MDRFAQYVKEVTRWNTELRTFLESQEIERSENLWENLDRLTKIIEEFPDAVDESRLVQLQAEVESLHQQMEDYFSERQQLGSIWINEPSVPAGEHRLPPLPYSYDALEPHISSEIMRLHHEKHHQSYVNGLNKAEKALKEARQKNDFDMVQRWSEELAFHGSGHYLHSIFWGNMSPNGGGRPKGKLLNMIESYFGSFEAFKKHFTEAANQVPGPGWAILVWSPRSRHLEILQSHNHMLYTQWDTIPILVLDVWEHAYYLQYKNNKKEYIENWWHVVNWKNAERRLERAAELKWTAY